MTAPTPSRALPATLHIIYMSLYSHRVRELPPSLKPTIPTVEPGQPENRFTEMTAFPGHSDIVRLLAMATGDRLISAADDRSVIVWSVKTSQRLLTLRGHQLPATCALELPASGRSGRLVTGSNDKWVILWSLSDGTMLGRHSVHSSWSPSCLSCWL